MAGVRIRSFLVKSCSPISCIPPKFKKMQTIAEAVEKVQNHDFGTCNYLILQHAKFKKVLKLDFFDSLTDSPLFPIIFYTED